MPHQHALRFVSSSGKTCSLCRNASPCQGYMQCEACRYMECEPCWGSSGSRGTAHGHQLQTRNFENRSCDLCRANLSASSTNMCILCNYDECDACIRRTGSSSRAADTDLAQIINGLGNAHIGGRSPASAPAPVARRSTGPHSHALSPVRSPTRVCDMCGGRSSAQSYMHCDHDDYDECDQCWQRSGSHAAAHPHELQVRAGAGRRCDLCRRMLQGKAALTCVLCDYDECEECYRRSGSRANTGGSPPARQQVSSDAALHVLEQLLRGAASGGATARHAHQLKPVRGARRCDVCGGTSTTNSYMNCQPDDYDECEKCWLRGQSQAAAHVHPLSRTDGHNRQCDMCRRDLETATSHQCILCDYDECEDCFRRSASQDKRQTGGPLPYGALREQPL